MEVTFVIGLPGSGKSYLLEYYKSHPFIEYKIYDDWMEWTLDSHSVKEFNSDIHYKELLDEISKGSDIMISCIYFCKLEFLNKAEYFLKTKFPEIKINKVYFENRPDKCEQNIKYRDKKNGGYWKPNEKGEMWYYGQIYEDKPLYKREIKIAQNLSKSYYIPIGITPLKIKLK